MFSFENLAFIITTGSFISRSRSNGALYGLHLTLEGEKIAVGKSDEI
jgi:hypothetical protein